MRIPPSLALLLATVVPCQSMAAEPLQVNKVKLSVVKYDDHVQLQCNPISMETAMRTDWKKICNDMAMSQVQKLAADGIIVPVKDIVFGASAVDPGAGPMLSRDVPLKKTATAPKRN